jgi:hypothetical protein
MTGRSKARYGVIGTIDRIPLADPIAAKGSISAHRNLPHSAGRLARFGWL